MTVDVKRNLFLLRRMNPNGMQHGCCQEEADRCKWAADTIELLAKTLKTASSNAVSYSEFARDLIKDRRLVELIVEVE